MDTGLRAIVDLSLDDVRRELTKCLATPLNSEAIEDYLASVDWSRAECADDGVRRLLGEIEALVHALGEKEISEEAAGARLRTALLAPAV
jgi:hypothetical protein